MLYTIHNDALTVAIDGLGAQLMSITAADGTEYLWNGDPAYWAGRAPAKSVSPMWAASPTTAIHTAGRPMR